MKRTESKSVVSIITVAVFALLAGCASIPFDEISVEFFDDFFTEAKTYNGGE